MGPASSLNLTGHPQNQHTFLIKGQNQLDLLDGLPLGAMTMEDDELELESDPNEVMDVPPWPVDQWRDLFP